jgi:hypothetical protein
MSCIRGTCTDFCPSPEAATRDLTECERCAGTQFKRYSRPAAGREVQASEVRTLETLVATVSRLLLHTQHCPCSGDICAAFVSDRLRAVRQDLTVQAPETLASPVAVKMMVACLRYYAFVAFSLAGVLSECWDPVFNDQAIAETLGLASALLESAQMHATGGDPMLDYYSSELAAYRCVLSWGDAMELSAAFKAVERLGPTSHRMLALVSRASVLWAARSWSAFLGELRDWEDEIRAASAATFPAPRVVRGLIALRCLAHRFVPSARTALLRALNAAFLDRQPVPLMAVSDLLRIRTGNTASSCASSDAINGLLCCAQFASDWGLKVRLVSTSASGAAGGTPSNICDEPVRSAELRAFLESIPAVHNGGTSDTSGSTCALDALPHLSKPVVAWNKSAEIDPFSLSVTARLAMTPRCETAVASAIGITGHRARWPTTFFEDVLPVEARFESRS